jgi:hypothetical protein
MNVGDLRHAENFEAQANLTAEQAGWSASWDLIRRLQAGKGRLPYGFAGLVPVSRRVADSLNQEFISHKDVLCVTMLPMRASRSSRFHKENRPVRLQTTVARFRRDQDGRPVAGGNPSSYVMEGDASKHPTQDHPVVRVMAYDPHRGEREERYGLSLFGQKVTSGEPMPLLSPAAGVFTTDTTSSKYWTLFLLDEVPIYRIPKKHFGDTRLLVGQGSVVSADEPLASLTGSEPFTYFRAEYVDGKPQIEDSRVLSPLSGDVKIQLDDLYANVYVTSGRFTALVARFHKADVLSGDVVLLPEREVRGTGLYERARDMKGVTNRVPWRCGDEWLSLVKGCTCGTSMIAKLNARVSYGLAEFHPDGKPCWDRVSFHHDILPVSRADCKPPLRLVGKMLDWAKRKLLKPADERYPINAPVEANWPRPWAVFSETQLESLGHSEDFTWSLPLQQALCDMVSPKRSFSLGFTTERKGQQWRLVGSEDDFAPNSRMLRFGRCENGELVAEPPITFFVPQCAVVHQDVLDGGIVEDNQAVADWVPRKFYTFEELREVLGNNLGWFTNAYFQFRAVRRESGVLLPENFVSCEVTPDQDWMLQLGTDARPEDGVIMLTPLDRTDQEVFTWSVNDIHFDVTPPHLLAEGAATTEKPKRTRRPRRQRS